MSGQYCVAHAFGFAAICFLQKVESSFDASRKLAESRPLMEATRRKLYWGHTGIVAWFLKYLAMHGEGVPASAGRQLVPSGTPQALRPTMARARSTQAKRMSRQASARPVVNGQGILRGQGPIRILCRLGRCSAGADI